MKEGEKEVRKSTVHNNKMESESKLELPSLEQIKKMEDFDATIPIPELPPPPPVETYHNFFKQKHAMNFENYLKLKNKEKMAVKKYNAALMIQKVFRGWLIRCNMKLINDAAIKIQSLWRRAIARERYKILDKARQEKRLLDLQNKMATKIQAAWRGYSSRKHNFNFKKFKEIQAKNRNAQEAANISNDLNALSGSTLSSNRSGTDQANKTHSSMIKSLENLLGADLTELASKLTPSRIAELYAYAKSGNKGEEETDEEDKLEKLAGYLKKVEGSESQDMFPDLPDTDDYYHTDPNKVKMLREAIKLLRDKIQKEELNKLSKVHYLMRTAAIPGVYSDIYTNELTDIEKKMKELKFLNEKALEQKLRSNKTLNQPIVVQKSFKKKSYQKSQAQLAGQLQFQNKKRYSRNVFTSSSTSSVNCAEMSIQNLSPHPMCCACVICCTPCFWPAN